jgi:autotransporter adhesin
MSVPGLAAGGSRALYVALAAGISFAALAHDAAAQAVAVTPSIAPAYPGTTVTNEPANNPPLFIETSSGTTSSGLPGLTAAENAQYQALQAQLTTITTAQQGLQDEWEADYLTTCGADNYPGTAAALNCAIFLPNGTPAEQAYRNRAFQILLDYDSYNQQAKTVRNDMRPLLSSVSTSGAGFRCNDEMTDVIFGLDVAGAAIELSGFILEAATSPGSWVGAEVAANVLTSVGQGLNVAGLVMTGIQNELPNCEGVFTGTVQTYANFQSKMGLSTFDGAITLGYDGTPATPFDANNQAQYYYSGITMGGGGLAGAGFGGAQAFTGDVSAIAIGNGASATSVNSTAIGNSASASAVGATAIGANTFASAENATAVGISAQARGVASTGVGAFSQAVGARSSAFGASANAQGDSSTAVGDSAAATGLRSTAIGVGAGASNDNTTAVGRSSLASGVSASAFGNGANATGASSTAAGDGSLANNINASAYGRITQATGANASAFGNDARATGLSSTASGDASRATADNTSSYGRIAQATAANASAFGNNAQATGVSSSAGGDSSLANNTFTSAFGRLAWATGVNASAYGNASTASGQSSTAVGDGSGASATNSSAFGNLALASAANAVAGGNSSWADGANSSAYGNNSLAAGASSVAVGDTARAQAVSSVAVGHDSLAAGPSAIAVGHGAQAINSVAMGAFAYAANGGAAFGDGARAYGTDATALGPNAVASHTNSVAIGADSFTTAMNTVSFGSVGNERRLMNVADALLGTDAVNLNQLGRAVQGLNRGIAATTALAVPMLSLDRGETSFATGAGYFEGETGVAFRVAHQMDIEMPILLSAGYSTAGGQTGAAQAGIAFKF